MFCAFLFLPSPTISTFSAYPTNHHILPCHVRLAVPQQSSKEYSEDEDEQDLPPPFQRLAGNGEEVRSAFSRFARDSARQSLASNNSAVFRWMEAQQRAEEEAEGFQVKLVAKAKSLPTVLSMDHWMI